MSLDESKRPDTDEVTEQADNTPAVEEPTEAAEETAEAATSADDREEAEEDRFSAFANPVRPEEKAPKKHRMNKRLRTLVIALAAVVVLVAVLLLIPLLPEEGEGSSGTVDSSDDSTVTYTLLDKGIDTDEDSDETPITVTKATINNSDGTFTFQYNEKEEAYFLEGYADIDLEATVVSTMTDCATTLTAQDKLTTVSDLADYGLDKPAVTATFTYHDKSTATLLVGDMTPAQDGYYTKLKDSSEVYICSESMLSPFMMTAGEYVEATLIATPEVKEDDANGNAVLRELSLSGKALTQPLTLRRTTTSDSAEFTYFTYLMTKPYMRGVAETAATDLSTFTSLTASRAVVLHPTAKQLAEYGFNAPSVVAQITLAVETAGETENEDETAPTVFYNNAKCTVTIGSTDDSGNYYVMVDDVNAIFLVSSSSLSVIAERRYDNTVSELLFLKDITQLGRAQINVGGTVYDLKLTHIPDEEDSDKKLTVTMGDKTLSTPDFRTLYQLAMGLNRYGAAETTPSGNPALALAFYLEDGSLYLSADFYATSGSRYTAKTSQGETFTIKASTVTNFINQVNNYVNGKEVLSN